MVGRCLGKLFPATMNTVFPRQSSQLKEGALFYPVTIGKNLVKEQIMNRRVAPFKPVSPGLQTFLGIFVFLGILSRTILTRHGTGYKPKTTCYAPDEHKGTLQTHADRNNWKWNDEKKHYPVLIPLQLRLGSYREGCEIKETGFSCISSSKEVRGEGKGMRSPWLCV